MQHREPSIFIFQKVPSFFYFLEVPFQISYNRYCGLSRKLSSFTVPLALANPCLSFLHTCRHYPHKANSSVKFKTKTKTKIQKTQTEGELGQSTAMPHVVLHHPLLTPCLSHLPSSSSTSSFPIRTQKSTAWIPQRNHAGLFRWHPTTTIRCMANPRRVAMVAKQIRRELSDMLLTDNVLQYAILPEVALGADRYLSSLTTISDVEVSTDLQVYIQHLVISICVVVFVFIFELDNFCGFYWIWNIWFVGL